MSKLANVWVFSDNAERYAELMTGARQWGEQVHIIVQGSEQANQVLPLGPIALSCLSNLPAYSELKTMPKPSLR